MPPANFSTAPDDIDVAALFRAVSKRKVGIALLALAAGVVTFAGLLFVTPQYTSEARILIEREDNTYKRPAALQNSAVRRVQTDMESVASQVQVLLSRDLAAGAVKALNLENDPEFNNNAGASTLWSNISQMFGIDRRSSNLAIQKRVLDAFQDRLNVYQIKGSHVIAISFRSRNPQTAAKAANTLAEFYLTWQQNEKLEQTKEASAWLSTQISQLTKTVEQADIKAEKFRSASGLLEGRQNITLNAQQLSELNSQLIIAKAQRADAVARAELIKKMLKEKGDVAAAADVLKSPLIQNLLEQRVQVQRTLAEFSATLLPSHPRLKQLNSELTDLRRQIRREARKVVASLQNEAQIASAREVSSRENLAKMKRSTARGNENQIKLRALEREATANRELLESYLARYRDASARSDYTSIPSYASIVSRAYISSTPSFPKKGPISLIAFAAIGFLGLAHTVARELIMGQHVVRPGAGEIAAPYADRSPTPAPRLFEQHSVSEITRRLEMEDPGRIIITPACERFEASAKAIEVARALAASGRRVVLVDALAETDHIAITMDLPDGPGISQLLYGKAQFEDVIRRDPGSSLHVISGPDDARRLPVLNARKMHSLLLALEAAYDRIILYAGPEQARMLTGIPARKPAAIVLVAGAYDSSNDAARWIADDILDAAHTRPTIMLLGHASERRALMPQFLRWNRAA